MLKIKDFILIGTTYMGIAGGIFLPQYAGFFTPYTLFGIMCIMFLSFLRIDFQTLFFVRRKEVLEVGVWTIAKTALMPVAFWALARRIAPDYALAVLLVSGVSTGVVAPFISNLLGMNTNRVLQSVITTSLILPVSLPALVKILMGQQIRIPFWDMARLLALAVFVPMFLMIVSRRIIPSLLNKLTKIQYPLSLFFFTWIPLGVFAKFSGYLRTHHDAVLEAAVIAFVLAFASALLGVAIGFVIGNRPDDLTGSVCLTFINNMLIVVFGAQFFGPEGPLLGAMYILPFFFMIVPFRWFVRIRRSSGSAPEPRPGSRPTEDACGCSDRR